ncbi:MAG TPA: MBL fold metallo-hydrolase [Isosphaeraceae bacterium]|jgi:phosphoribosyl 1,2-cyclic phosphodiesterase|nr:MBL fold metallo-hydrolase [Isosphaeraceae bacterium]
MPVQFAVLASGSRGNATLVQAGGAGLLVDAGLGPRRLAERLAAVGSAWERVACVVLTHTHGDHVENASLHWMASRGITLICHDGHRPTLDRLSGFQALVAAGLTRSYDETPFLTPNGMRVEPITLHHDGGPTFGFRIEGRAERRGRWVSLGYLADTGCWTETMVGAVADVDVLGIEFNHDIDLQRRSGRSPALIGRILGDHGHLSNHQAADFVSAVLARSRPGALRHVVLLHLSEECNLPELALSAAQKAVRLASRRSTVIAAEQHTVCPDLLVTPGRQNATGKGTAPDQTGAPRAGRPSETQEMILF